MTDISHVAAVADAETLIQEAITDRVEDDNETRVALAEIDADTAIAIAETQADAAVAIAETDEVDGEWLQSQLSALAADHARILEAIGQLAADLQTIAVALISQVAPSIPTLSEPIVEPVPIVEPIAIVEPTAAPASVSIAPKRQRRLF